VLLEFFKYEGAGNDFILINDRQHKFLSDNQFVINRLCDCRFGIGADGFIILRSLPGFDFKMPYYNADGKESTMCGNGWRCITAFAGKLGVIKEKVSFIAVDGEHQAELKSDNYISLKMNDVTRVESGKDYYNLDTGSPHYVTFQPSVKDIDIYSESRKIRFNERFAKEGINVDFVENCSKYIFVRTYERGVENETLACGTGVVASVIYADIQFKHDKISASVPVKVMGGLLNVSCKQTNQKYTDIWLDGPANFVFKGKIAFL
jgi:diaminopimelate epimerase